MLEGKHITNAVLTCIVDNFCGEIAMETLLTPSAAAAVLGLKPAALVNDRRLPAPKFPYVRLSRKLVRYRPSDLQRVIEGGLVGLPSTDVAPQCPTHQADLGSTSGLSPCGAAA